jgi:hypothetical protein
MAKEKLIFVVVDAEEDGNITTNFKSIKEAIAVAKKCIIQDLCGEQYVCKVIKKVRRIDNIEVVDA